MSEESFGYGRDKKGIELCNKKCDHNKEKYST